MRDVVVLLGICIDGYVPGGPDEGVGKNEPEHADVVARQMAGVSPGRVHAMGRVAYKEMAGFGATSTAGDGKPMNKIPRVVFSTTLTRAHWVTTKTTTITGGNLAEDVPSLKAHPGGELIVHGGYPLTQALTRANFVDEYRLVTPPVALGSGEPPSKDLPVGLRLRSAEVTPCPDGAVVSIYRRPR